MARCQQCYADMKTGLECSDLQMKEQNGQYGPPRHGKREKISSSRIYCCGVQGCKNKARFLMTGCYHKFCGHCLYEKEVILNFVTHSQKTGFACPECAYIERGDMSNTRWVFKSDVYSLLQEKSLCVRCFQVKTFDVPGCKHGMCFACMKRLLDDKRLLEYKCVMNECQAKYNRSEIVQMYERTITEMSWKLFEMPDSSDRKCNSCENLAFIEIRKCDHQFCWDCVIKCTPKDKDSTNCFLMKCSIQDCNSSFPAECLHSYCSRITSTMQLATINAELVRITTCSGCSTFIYQLLVKFHPCTHSICLPCYEKFMVKLLQKREKIYLGVSMKMTKCCVPNCDMEIPSACLKAIELAIKGDEIAIAMYFQHPKRNGKGQCSSCDVEKVYLEIVPCKHQLCKRCMEMMYSASNKWGIASCKKCGMPVLSQWLKTVLEKPFGEFLVNNRNYFEELTKNAESELVDTEFQDIDAHAGGFATPVTNANSTSKINSKDRNTDLLCPSYEEWTICSYCLQMAVIIFTTCSHGWCLKCLKFLINSQKDDKLQCKDCTSCGSIGNGKRCIRKYEAEGLLVPSYLKPVSGSTCCNICSKKQAILQEIDCGHRFCESCWCMCLQFRCLKCPVLACERIDIGNQEPSKTSNANRRCDICSRKKSEFAMTKCDHAFCKDCIFRIVRCPVKGCKSYMDEASCDVVSKHIKKKKEVLFLSNQPKTKDGVSACSGNHCVKHESEPKVQVRRCKHIICNQCFVNLQEIGKDIGMSTCPANDCAELFFLPLSHSTGDHTTESGKEDRYIKSKVPKESNESADKRSENATDSTLLQNGKQPDTDIFSFRKYIIDKNGVRQRGLPNLGFTCYRNSVFQVLAESSSFLDKLRETTNDTKEDWTFTLCEIMWRVYSKNTSRADIEYWLNRMQAEFTAIDNSFVEYRQNDSLSFLTSILSGVADEMQNKRQKYKDFKLLSDPSEIFKGQIHDKYTCCKCKKTENHGESDFFSLPLPALESGTPKIGECLYQFFTTETLRDVFPCTYCKHGTVLKEIQITKYPNVLVLQLGMISERRDGFERVQRPPRFWENFEGLTNRLHLSKIDKKEFSKYTLYGVIVHTGGLTGGHYYAYVKRLESEKWERCDDSYVKEVDVKEVLRSNAYILFYQKWEKGSR